MNITIIGTGYVGLVTGVCLSQSEIGCNVTCVDVDEQKINLLSDGIPTIYEKGLLDQIYLPYYGNCFICRPYYGC